MLILLESPTLTKKPPSKVYVDIGSNLTLCCEAEASLVWSRAKGALTLPSSFQQQGCLSMRNVKNESTGKYTCRATNEFGFAESTTEVIVTGYVAICLFRLGFLLLL